MDYSQHIKCSISIQLCEFTRKRTHSTPVGIEIHTDYTAVLKSFLVCGLARMTHY